MTVEEDGPASIHVTHVRPHSAADAAGLREGDRLITLNDTLCWSAKQVTGALAVAAEFGIDVHVRLRRTRRRTCFFCTFCDAKRVPVVFI